MGSIMLTVLNMSMTASFVILAVCVARLLLKKAPKGISYALWAVVAFRLVIPFSFESMFSLMPIKQNPIPQDIVNHTLPQIDTGLGIFDNIMNAALPVFTPDTSTSVNSLQTWLTVGEVSWIVGIAVMIIYSIVTINLLKYQLKNARLLRDNIYEADALKTPFVLGYINPKIYIPTKIKSEEKNYIILHERVHIKRKDHIIKLVAYLILCLHWFNPLVWMAFVLMGADMEFSCDEQVLKKLGSGIKKNYSTSLLSFSTNQRIINGSPLAFGEGGVKNRIKNVLNFKKPSIVIIIAAAIIVTAVGVGFMTNKTSTSISIDEKPKTITAFDIGKVKIGMTVNEVHGILKDPHGMLSGFWGDVYYVNDGSKLTIYYDSSGKVREIMLSTSDGFLGNSESRTMSIDDLKTLAKKGNSLQFEDFTEYLGVNLSSAAYSYLGLIRLNAPYRLIIRAENGVLTSATLEGIWEDSGTGIDIRFGDLESFINDRPVNLVLKEGSLSKAGATFVLSNLTNKDYSYGQFYILQRKTDSGWEDVGTVIDNYYFDDLGYKLVANGNNEVVVNWEWLYGKLPNGDYRIFKEVSYRNSFDEHDTYPVYATFTLNY